MLRTQIYPLGVQVKLVPHLTSNLIKSHLAIQGMFDKERLELKAHLAMNVYVF